jgi:small-conductance mechanosensitive channel
MQWNQLVQQQRDRLTDQIQQIQEMPASPERDRLLKNLKTALKQIGEMS